MEQTKKSYLRSAVAVALVTAMLLVVPLAVVTQDYGVADDYDIIPMISIRPMMVDGQNMTLSVDANGNIQAKFDVYVENTELVNGAYIHLKYNTAWLQPSDWDNNSVITSDGMAEMRGSDQDFFIFNEDLYYQIKDGPVTSAMQIDFKSTESEEDLVDYDYYRMLDSSNGVISLQLELNQEKLKEDYGDIPDGSAAKSLIRYVGVGEENEDSDPLFYFDNRKNAGEASANIAVKLGTLSFRVTSRDALRQMVEFGDSVGGSEHWYKISDDNFATPDLTKPAPFFVDPATTEITTGGSILNPEVTQIIYDNAWHLFYYTSEDDNGNPTGIYTSVYKSAPANNAAAGFYYDFGRRLVTAEPLAKEITINAYQAYSYDGNDAAAALDNMEIVLGKYSPTIVASYADAATRNFVMNWGASNRFDADTNIDYIYDYTIYAKLDVDETAIADYVDGTVTLPADCILHSDGGSYTLWQDVTTIIDYEYNPKQGEYIARQNLYYENIEGEIVQYPAPMEVHITVTPVTVVNVGADGLHKVYTAAYAEQEVTDYSKFELPDEIHLYTDVISGAPSLYLTVGGAEELPAWMPNAYADVKTLSRDNATTLHWPSADDSSAATYTFTVGTLATDSMLSDSEVNRHTSAVYGTEINQKYPWLTVKPKYNIDATRTVYPANTAVDVPDQLYVVAYKGTEAEEYTNIGSDDYSADELHLDFTVGKTNTNDTFGDAAAFKLRLPNGWVIEPNTGEPGTSYANKFTVVDAAGTRVIVEGDSATESDSKKAQYAAYGTASGSSGTIALAPGSDNFDADTVSIRDTIRRHINLGGYFAVSVCENINVDAPIWSDFIEVYVPPRANYYEEDKTYNFIGLNAGLFEYTGQLADTITVPEGDYYPLIIDNTENTNTHSLTAESYGVLTTYDGLTGAQPGRTYTFKVEHASDTEVWSTAQTKASASDPSTPDSTLNADTLIHDNYKYFGGATITRFNAADDAVNRYADMTYDGYGAVKNSREIDSSVVEFEPTIRLEEPKNSVDPAESLRLIYEGTATNNVLKRDNGEVAEVVFDTQTEGYTVRQSFVLTLVNDGTVDIHGLYIDSLRDDGAELYTEDGGGGHFEIVTPPASYLAAGAKTTFTVTYVYDLKAGGDVLEYLDKLFVCSNAYGSDTPLKEFDARFAVTRADIYRVTVVVLPPFEDADGNTFYLGEAGVINGPDAVTEEMDYTYTSTMRTVGTDVFIGTFPYEEYKVELVLADGVENTQGGTTVGGYAELVDKYDDGKEDGVYRFEMPANNVTVYVIFREPTRSKLRPGDLRVYADAYAHDKYDPEDPSTYMPIDITEENKLKTLWQKDFTTSELANANALDPNRGESYNSILMTGGAAGETGFDASVAHYLVVLEQDESIVQAEAILRQVEALYEDAHADPTVDPNDPNDPNTPDNPNVTYEALVGALGSDAYAANYRNVNIAPVNVVMKVYDEGESPLEESDKIDVIYTNVAGETAVGSDGDPYGTDITTSTEGNTATPTLHRGIVFDAPEEGKRRWLVITLSFDATEVGDTGEDINGDTDAERSYYIELVRRPSHSVTLAYGNSPVGMIYNTKDFVETNTAGEVILTAEKERTLNEAGEEAFDTFVETRSFETSEKMPHAPYAFRRANSVLVTDDHKSYTYNREAWIPYGELYDPDSLTYTDSYAIGEGGTNTDTSSDIIIENADNTTTVIPVLDEYDTYESYIDLDLDPHALFVVLGEDFRDPGLVEIKDSSMREVEARFIKRYIREVALLDESATTELDRFGSVETAKIDLRTLYSGLEIAAADWQAKHKYVQAELVRGTESYPLYVCYDDVDGEKYFLDGTRYFYEDDAGVLHSLDEVDDAAIIEKLEPLLVDENGEYGTPVSLRPGVYELVYEFMDFDGTREIAVSRKLVVLAPVGDANADHVTHTDDTANNATSVEESDETLVEQRVGALLGYEVGYDGANVFKFRSVDANNDRNVNNIDANTLHSKVTDTEKLPHFYDPFGYAEEVTYAQ